MGQVGAVVYARVSLAHPFAEPEVECLNPTTQKAESFGELSDGMLLRDVELSRCRRSAPFFRPIKLTLGRLLTGEDDTLTKLGSQKAYEVAVGVNGRSVHFLPGIAA
jgi:exosome complex component RRP40